MARTKEKAAERRKKRVAERREEKEPLSAVKKKSRLAAGRAPFGRGKFGG
jgi:hypothetical protein